MLEGSARPPDAPERGKRVAMIAGGVLVTGLLAGLALSLGSWGFRHRSASLHEGRLARLVEQEPRLQQVVSALIAEGATPLAASAGDDGLRRLAEGHGGARAAEIEAKGRRHAQTRAFRAGDAVYVLYFDKNGILRDYTCVTR
jgi:hypothetical protein